MRSDIYRSLNRLAASFLLIGTVGINAFAAESNSSHSQSEIPPEKWTLDQAIEWAFTHNVDILQAIERANRFTGVRMVGGSSILPRVRISADVDAKSERLIDLPNDTVSGVDPETRQATEGYGTTLEIRQSLLFGQRGAIRQYQADKLNEAAAKANRVDVIQRVIAILTQSFDTVLFAEENVEIRKTNVTTFTRFLDTAEKRFDAGDVAELEILRLKSELNRSKADLARAESQLSSAKERFKRLLSIEGTERNLTLLGSLTLSRQTTDFDALIVSALAHRMDLKAAKLEWESAAKQVAAAKTAKLPQIEAVAGYDNRSSFYDVDRSVDGWRVGLVASADIFAGGRNKGTRMIRESEANAARLRYESLKMQIESSVREFQVQLKQHESIIDSRRSALEFAEKALEQIEAQYEAGAAGIEIVLNAQDSLNKARFEMAQSIVSHNATVAQLEYATSSSPKYSLLSQAELDE